MSTVLSREELPALYLAASDASRTAQRWYTRLIRFNLILLVFGSFLSSFSITPAPSDTSTNNIMYILYFLSLIILAISGIITLIIYFRRFEKDWYAGRAIAESVKTLAWRYMTGTKPYGFLLSDKAVDEKFKEDLKQILGERKYMAGALGGQLATRPQVTDRMRRVRKMSTNSRKQLYVENRIENQKKWYSNKSANNKRWENFLFCAVGGSQLFAIGGALYMLQHVGSVFNPTGVFTAMAASFIAWGQLKQYQTLSQSYGLASQELGLILIESTSIRTDKELSEFVLDSENAISREHTLWIARKEKVE